MKRRTRVIFAFYVLLSTAPCLFTSGCGDSSTTGTGQLLDEGNGSDVSEDAPEGNSGEDALNSKPEGGGESSADSVENDLDGVDGEADASSRVPDEDVVVPDTILDVLNPDTISDENDTMAPDTMDEDKDAVSVYEPPPEWWGDPIATKPNSWEWVEFPESRCADGSPTGLGINVSPGATKALVYFEGGGACWNYATCFGVIQTSFHLTGYDEGSFKGLIAEVYKNSLLLNREDANNPLSDAHLVFLPYCTGDAFLGTQVTTLDGPLWAEGEIHFWGRNNVLTYLERLAPTFEGVDHIVVSGGSAGGFGAGFSWSLFQEAFPGIRVDVLDDSGPPLDPAEGQWEAWKEAWNPEFPQNCPNCTESVGALLDYFRTELLQNGKFGLLSYNRDGIISTFFGLLPFQFENRLMELCDLLDEEPDAHYFVVPGLLHTMTILGYDGIEADDGTPLWWWITQMVNDDPNWKSYRP